jgi:hypothetical protein
MSDPFEIFTLGWEDGNHTIHLYSIDSFGNSNHSWYFFTMDATLPEVISSTPSNNSINVSLSNTVTIVFSEPMNRVGFENHMSISPSIPFSIEWNNNGTVCSISFIGEKLTKKTTYNLIIKSNIADVNGNHMTSDFILVFTTEDTQPDSNEFIIIEILIVLLFGIKRKKSQKSPDSKDEPIALEEVEEGKSEGSEGGEVRFQLPPNDLKPLSPPPPPR